MRLALAAALCTRVGGGRVVGGVCRSRGLAMVGASGRNPLLDHGGLPRFEAISADQVEPAVDKCLAELESEFAKLESGFTKAAESGKVLSYGEVVESMEKVEAPLSFAWGAVSHLMSVKNSDELRNAHDAAQPKVVRTMQKLSQSEAYYQALKSLDQSILDPVQVRIVQKGIQGMEMSGIGLPDAVRQEFNDLNLRKSELSSKFSNNLLDSTKAFELLLSDPADVSGLPETARAMLAQTAVSKGHEGASAESGPWVVTLDGPPFMQFMRYADSSALREKVYKAYISRASEGELDNQPIIEEILSIRQKTTGMLGFQSYNERSFTSKMAESPGKVMELTTFVRDRALPLAKQEFAELEAFAESKGYGASPLKHWDVAYWSEKLKEERFKFSQEELRPYFSLEAVLDGLFRFSERLFNIKIAPADGETSVWHQDVRFFHVFDAADVSAPIAAFYLDPYSRPAEKRGGAWMGVCQGKSKVLERIPVAYLVCNGSPPTADKPSLMTFSDVETLWHEVGHALQHMATQVEHADAAGISLIEWDAVELPSQFMEEWLYDKTTLYSFAKHFETGAPIPDELFDKLVASRHFHAGMHMVRQLNFGALDLALHSGEYDSSSTSPLELQRAISKEYSVRPPLPEDRFLCSFAHIFAGGYASGYYSYLFSRILSTDAFSAFEEVGLDNDKQVMELGLKFRQTVLALGGGTHPAEVFRQFRGRDPNPEALLRLSGITGAAATPQAKL